MSNPVNQIRKFTVPVIARFLEARPINASEEGGRGRVQGKGEGPRNNWEKVQVVWICRGAGVIPSRVIRDEYRI